ncbi:MAG: chaperone modulator CbpM [Candidatus Dormibacterales bacterium]
MPEGADPRHRLADRARVEVSVIRRYERAGCIEVTEVVDEIAVRRLRRVHRLRRDLGLDLHAIAIIVRLIERLERAEGG